MALTYIFGTHFWCLAREKAACLLCVNTVFWLEYSPWKLSLTQLCGWIWTAPRSGRAVHSEIWGATQPWPCYWKNWVRRPQWMTSGGDITEDFFFLCLTFSKLSTVSMQVLILWNNVLVSVKFLFPKAWQHCFRFTCSTQDDFTENTILSSLASMRNQCTWG